jgi:heme/copper-type cytochrome/quinol oxidase subunit 1
MMTTDVRWFIRSSLLWLVGGVLLGLAVALAPTEMALLRPAHLHMNLLGFVSLMIFGVAYHVLPRFTGIPVRRPALVRANLLLSNAGLGVMVLGWAARAAFAQGPTGPGMASVSGTLLAIGGSLAASGALLFVVNLWGVLSQRSVSNAPGSRPGPACGGNPPPDLIQLNRHPRY